MKRARVVGAWGISFVVGAGLLWACSSSTTENGNTGGNTQDATTGGDTGSLSGDDGGSNTKDSGVITKKDGSTDDGGTGPCGATASQNDCYACCDGISDGGVNEFFTLQFECICDTKKCGTVAKGCKNTLCANPDVDDAGVKCNACQDKIFADDAGDAGCNDPVFNECAADMGCAQGISCVIDSNCDSKP